MTEVEERDDGGGPSSLALYAKSVASHEHPAVEGRCPRKLGFLMLNLGTGETCPARCRANFCPWCGPLNASLIGGAIALARPDRAILLTDVGDEWQTARNRAKQFAYHVKRKLGVPFDWCWHMEPNPKDTGHHMHAWQRGKDFLPQRALAEVARSVGMGPVAFVNRVKSKRGEALGYGMKLAGVAYGMKMAEAEDTMGVYLEANGNRLVHASRGFWRDEDGKAFSGQREAMTAWARRSRTGSDDQGEWVLVAEGQLAAARSHLAVLSAR